MISLPRTLGTRGNSGEDQGPLRSGGGDVGDVLVVFLTDIFHQLVFGRVTGGEGELVASPYRSALMTCPDPSIRAVQE